MPVLTVALFALAGVVLAVAIVIQQMAGGGGDDDNSPAQQVGVNATNTAIAATSQASGGGQTPANQTPAAGETPNGTTPGTTTTPGAGTTTTPGASGRTHTVQAGEFCGTIATDAGITIDQFFQYNPNIDRSCNNLSVGQVVNIAP